MVLIAFTGAGWLVRSKPVAMVVPLALIARYGAKGTTGALNAKQAYRTFGRNAAGPLLASASGRSPVRFGAAAD